MPALTQQHKAQLIAFAAVTLVMLALGILIGRISTPAPLSGVTASPTRLIATPTPRLVLQTPHVLASFLTPANGIPCDSCNSLTFTSDGPFDLISSCQPLGMFAGSLPNYTFQLYDGNGHLVDTVQQPCGDPNTNAVAIAVIPENLPGGTYKLNVSPSGSQPVGVVILDAAPHAG